MSLSPNSRLVQRTIELNYANKKRETSLKWIVVNAVLLLVFVYDLSCMCPGYTSVLHYVELCCAVVMAANLLQYAVRLAPSRAPRLLLSPDQQKLLGLSSTDLDSSFILTEHNHDRSHHSDASIGDSTEQELSLWPRRSLPPRTPPQSTASPPSHPSPPSPTTALADDEDSLAEYLGRCAASGGPAPIYQLAALDTAGGGKPEESSPQGAPDAWRRLALDPQRLTQYNFNLRLWLHITILAPLARSSAADTAPLLARFADRRYAAARVAQLARGGCLSAYRWDGGGADWDARQPPDAELLLTLFAAYLDAQLPRPCSAELLAEGAAVAGRRLCVTRLCARPPHYALVWRGMALDVPRGRNNLLHTLLLFVAAVARDPPAALARTDLGPTGLNMLWIIGR